MITQEQRAINDLNFKIGILLMNFYKEYPNLNLKKVVLDTSNYKTHGVSPIPTKNKTFADLIFEEEQP